MRTVAELWVIVVGNLKGGYPPALGLTWEDARSLRLI